MRKRNQPMFNGLGALSQTSSIIYEDFYTYSVSATVPANGQTSVNFTIEADSNFEWLQTMNLIEGHVITSAAPLLGVQIKDAGTGRFLQQNPVNIMAMSGTGQLPHILPNPRLFKPSSVVTVTFTNDSGVPINAHLFFEGIKSWEA